MLAALRRAHQRKAGLILECSAARRGQTSAATAPAASADQVRGLRLRCLSPSTADAAAEACAEGSKAIEPSVKMADDYTKVTLQLSDGIESWARLDTYDPKRPKITQAWHPAAAVLLAACV